MKYVNLALLALLVGLQVRLWTGNGSIPDVQRLDRLLQEQVAANEQLRERNSALAAEVMDLKEGLEAVEERARSEMGMIRSGETYFQIVER
jgi:cell division protein FtsB